MLYAIDWTSDAAMSLLRVFVDNLTFIQELSESLDTRSPAYNFELRYPWRLADHE